MLRVPGTASVEEYLRGRRYRNDQNKQVIKHEQSHNVWNISQRGFLPRAEV